MLEPLKQRGFRLLFISRTIDQLGDKLAPVALAFGVLNLTGSASDLGLVLAARTVPLMIFVLVGGVWADRLRRNRVMLVADVVRGVSQSLAAVLLLSGHAQVWQLIALQAVHGSAGAFFIPAAAGLVPQVVEAPLLQRANGLLYTTRSVTVICGPALAGVIVLAAGPGWAIAGDALSFFVSAWLIGRLPRLPQEQRPAERPSFRTDLLEGWRVVRARSWLGTGLASLALYQAAVIAPMMVLGPVVARDALGGAGAWGAILSATGIGAVLGGLASLKVRFARPLLLAALLMLADLPQLASLAVPATVVVIAAAALLAGAAGGIYGTVWDTVQQAHVPGGALARVSSYGWFATTALQPVGYTLAGAAAGLIGVAPALWTAFAIELAITAAFVAVPSVRRLGPLPRQAPATAAADPGAPTPAEPTR